MAVLITVTSTSSCWCSSLTPTHWSSAAAPPRPSSLAFRTFSQRSSLLESRKLLTSPPPPPAGRPLGSPFGGRLAFYTRAAQEDFVDEDKHSKGDASLDSSPLHILEQVAEQMERDARMLRDKIHHASFASGEDHEQVEREAADEQLQREVAGGDDDASASGISFAIEDIGGGAEEGLEASLKELGDYDELWTAVGAGTARARGTKLRDDEEEGNEDKANAGAARATEFRDQEQEGSDEFGDQGRQVQGGQREELPDVSWKEAESGRAGQEQDAEDIARDLGLDMEEEEPIMEGTVDMWTSEVGGEGERDMEEVKNQWKMEGEGQVENTREHVERGVGAAKEKAKGVFARAVEAVLGRAPDEVDLDETDLAELEAFKLKNDDPHDTVSSEGQEAFTMVMAPLLYKELEAEADANAQKFRGGSE